MIYKINIKTWKEWLRRWEKITSSKIWIEEKRRSDKVHCAYRDAEREKKKKLCISCWLRKYPFLYKDEYSSNVCLLMCKYTRNDLHCSITVNHLFLLLPIEKYMKPKFILVTYSTSKTIAPKIIVLHCWSKYLATVQ